MAVAAGGRKYVEQSDMEEQVKTTTTAPQQHERNFAAFAHGSILLSIFTNGIGGVAAALVIWLTQKEKSEYVRFQALQALVYQTATFVLFMGLWFCWGLAWMGLMIPPLVASPEAYQTAPPPTMWVGLSLITVPICAGFLTMLYGLWGAIRTFAGHDFRYLVIGNWLAVQEAAQQAGGQQAGAQKAAARQMAEEEEE